MNPILSPSPHGPTGRALVLGGGGSTGNAWLIGVLAGLQEAGVDAAEADLVVGTSAGATAAAQLAGAALADLFAAILAETPPPHPPGMPGGRAAKPVSDQLARTDRIIAAAHDAADMRRRLGVAALDLAADYDPSDRWRATVAARLTSPRWPDRRLLITAVNAHTGDPVVFDRDSGMDLVDAVAASCASGFAYRIGSSAYIDGGYRSGAENADLAAGCSRVLVLSPFGGRTRTPLEWGLHLAAQVEGLHAGGSAVETVVPDRRSEHLFGANAMNASLRPEAARAGYGQGSGLAGQLGEFWR